MPNPEIIEVIRTSRRDFSLQELLQIASHLPNDETIFCSTPITPILRLMVELNNNYEQTDVVQISIYVFNRAHMRFDLPFPLDNRLIQRARIKGRHPVDPRALSLQDIRDIFEISENAIWHIDKYRYATSDGGTCVLTAPPSSKHTIGKE